jgi:hypothetical protein
MKTWVIYCQIKFIFQAFKIKLRTTFHNFCAVFHLLLLFHDIINY